MSAITRRVEDDYTNHIVDRHNQRLQTNCLTNHARTKPFVHSPSAHSQFLVSFLVSIIY